MAGSGSTPSRLHAWLLRHWLGCYALMTLAFLLFGLLSFDLVRLFSANAGLLWNHGWQGLLDGGLQQLLELLLGALGAVAAWLMFKLCEHVLVQRLAQR